MSPRGAYARPQPLDSTRLEHHQRHRFGEDLACVHAGCRQTFHCQQRQPTECKGVILVEPRGKYAAIPRLKRPVETVASPLLCDTAERAPEYPDSRPRDEHIEPDLGPNSPGRQ